MQPDHPEPQEKAVRRCPGAARPGAGARPMEGRAGAGQDRQRAHGRRHRVSRARRSAATKEELQQIAGFWPDIEKSRAEAKRLLKEAGAEGLTFELLNRNVDQPYKYVAALRHRRVEQDRAQGDAEGHPDRAVLRRRCATANFDVTVDFNCQGVVNPPARHGQVPAAYGLHRELRTIRGRQGSRALQQDAARSRPGRSSGWRCATSRNMCSIPRRTRS